MASLCYLSIIAQGSECATALIRASQAALKCMSLDRDTGMAMRTVVEGGRLAVGLDPRISRRSWISSFQVI